jgi:hypothetical protein
MTDFLGGLLTMGFAIAAVHFLRFWKRSGERLFIYFAVSFALLAVQRLGLALLPGIESNLVYGTRLFAFLLLLAGILEKNRKKV